MAATYVTRDILANRVTDRKLIQLLDDEKLADAEGTLDDAIIANELIGDRLDEILDQAQGYVDGYLRTRRSVPIADVDTLYPNIRRVASDIAIYYVASRRVLELAKIEGVEMLMRDAQMYLKGIANGTIEIGTATDPAVSTKVVTTTNSNELKYTVDTLKYF